MSAPQNAGRKGQDPVSFSDALTSTKFGFFNCFLIFISGLVLSIVVFESAALGFTLPLAQCDLELTNENKGIIMSIMYIGMIVSSHLWGFLADTKGRKAVMVPTLLVGSIASFASSFSINFWMLLILRFINGFFLAGGAAIIFVYLSEFHSDKTKAVALMTASIIFSLFAIMIPGLAYLVINRDWSLDMEFMNIVLTPWRLFMIVSSVPGLVCGILLRILPESPKFLFAKMEEEKCIAVLQQMYKWNGGKGALKVENLDIDEETEAMRRRTEYMNNFCTAVFVDMWTHTKPLFGKKYVLVTLVTCTMQFWIYFVVNGMFMWFPHVGNQVAAYISAKKDGATICEIVTSYEQSNTTTTEDVCITKLESTTYMYSMVMEILYFVYFLIISLLIQKIDKRIITFFIILSSAIFGIFSFILKNPVVAIYLYVLFFMVGVGNNVLGSATVEHYPTNLRGMAICLSLNGGRLGGVIGASCVGFLLKSNCNLTFYIGCGGLLFSAAITFLLPKTNYQNAGLSRQTLIIQN